jgi:predicted transcriptional regulator
VFAGETGRQAGACERDCFGGGTVSKAVLISIRPEWTRLILSGEKTIEVRKTHPHIKTPFKCYIYCTKGKGNSGPTTHFFESDDGTFYSDGRTFSAFLSGTVIGEFVCDEIIEDRHGENALLFENKGWVPFDVQKKYATKQILYGWHISELKIYDKPKELSEFMQCHKCEYYSGCKEHEYSCDGVYKVQRPPQSFCYVEELS